MNNNNYPVPPSHRTFQFGKIIIDSNFDSGNCSYAEKMGASTVLNLLSSLPFGLELIIHAMDIACGFIFQFREFKKVLLPIFKSKICKIKYLL